MSDKGKVLEVNNITLLFESLFGQFPDIPEDQKAQVRDQLIQAYGEKAFRGNIEIVTALFPRKKVAPGDKWIIETKLESGMEANVISEYEYLGQEEGFYRFHGESKLQTADKDAYIESNGIPIKYDLSGSMKSDIKVDKDSGWIIEASITQELQGDAYISANPNVTEDMKVPMKMKNVMRITDR